MDPQTTTERTAWYAPRHVVRERDGLVVLLDPETPNWISTDARGARILSWLDGLSTLEDVAVRYAREFAVESAKAWLHVDRFLREAARRGFASSEPFSVSPYPGRARYLEPRLRELWLHTNNSCNLACEHCLVSSGPGGDRGMGPERLLPLVDEAAELGVRRFYFTGGEPFLRRDVFDLVERVTKVHGRELRILTNGLLFQGAVLERLKRQDPERLSLQVSLDGASAATNDPVRGKGTFEKILAGIRTLVEAGFAPTVSTVITKDNVGEMEAMVRLVKETGAASWHLLWIHKKGRWADLNGSFVAPTALHAGLRKAHAEAERLGVVIDNIASFRARVNGAPGSRIDLSNAGVESLCVYSDGRVYPSAAMVQYEALEIGRWTGGNLGELLLRSDVAGRLQSLTVAEKPVCKTCQFKFLCGGGDIEHSFSYSLGRTPMNGRGSLDYLDPYCELYQGLITDRLFELAAEGRAAHRADTGYNAPVVYHAMGEGNMACAPGGDLEAYAPVRTSGSNCVVPPSGLDRPRALVQSFYARAAETPQAALCCPVDYDAADTAHIPKEVRERFYGCGGPMSLAGAAAGETVVDLGCGAGIDVFIAAKKVGPRGRAIGVDMTDPMLGVAGESKSRVAAKLGYDVAEFRKGYLEDVPLADGTADLVTSNCVINLSPDKKEVFREMWRVLKDHGRIVVSDIVADRPLPATLKVNVHLWGECVSGALPEDEFLGEIEKAGFYGVQVLKKQFWKEVDGYDFFSVTVRGYKFQKKAGCVFRGHRAVYLGPFVAATDEEGHLFPRGQAIEVCTDTVAKLSHAPYASSFALLEPGVDVPAAFAAGCESGACAPGCC
jgi:radical SAM protein with 4Fe4S-binding SPASM domain